MMMGCDFEEKTEDLKEGQNERKKERTAGYILNKEMKGRYQGNISKNPTEQLK